MKRVVAESDATGGLQYAICDHPDCDASFKLHFWGTIAADDDGWFVQRNGDCWCPNHIPDWVESWREQKAKSMGKVDKL